MSVVDIVANQSRHSYHLVDPSPWPFVGAFSAFSLTLGTALYMQEYSGGLNILLFGFYFILVTMYNWWGDIIREGTIESQHTNFVQNGLRWGVLLFIVSEVMFFFAFFWGFFHSSFNPLPELGGNWPPMYLSTFSPWEIPFLNTLLLLTSGAAVTAAHNFIVGTSKKNAIVALIITVVLASIFTAFQGYEYNTALFTISDGVYGSAFYMATGFHGFHVLVGTIFLIVCGFRVFLNHSSQQHHFGFEAAAWYWHFVDVVWIFLFITIYWWGN